MSLTLSNDFSFPWIRLFWFETSFSDTRAGAAILIFMNTRLQSENKPKWKSLLELSTTMNFKQMIISAFLDLLQLHWSIWDKFSKFKLIFFYLGVVYCRTYALIFRRNFLDLFSNFYFLQERSWTLSRRCRGTWLRRKIADEATICSNAAGNFSYYVLVWCLFFENLDSNEFINLLFVHLYKFCTNFATVHSYIHMLIF